MTTDFHMVAAALRQASDDLCAYAGVVTAMLADALPADCVTLERTRSVADKMRGREGQVRRMTVRLGDRALSLTARQGGGLVAEIHHEVRGVVLSRETVSLDVWLDALAQALVQHAEANTRAAEALRRLVAGPSL
jgi:hypothetical protein